MATALERRWFRHGLPVEPSFVAFVATASVAVALVHGIALALRALVADTGPAAALSLTAAVIVIAAAHVVSLVSRGQSLARWVGVGTGLAASAALVARYPAAYASAAALSVVAVAQTWAAGRLAERLTIPLSGVLARRPRVSVLWAALGLLLLVQSARLSTFMADPSFDFWVTTRDPLWAQHMCLPSFIEAADLQRQGVGNVYDARFYAVLDRSAKPALTVRNMDGWLGDPFQYPPPFLLLPRLALALTNDFLAVRTGWYVLQLLLFLSVALAVSAWIGGRTGWTAALLIPAVWISVPGLQSLQYGQFHAAAIALAIAGMLTFERQRHAAGGALLAAAALAKIFPAILLFWLIAQRRWRAVAWTVGLAGAFTLAAIAVFGASPFVSFVQYQLPRLADGRAFDFSAQWPELRVAFLADNLSPVAIPEKLRELGVPGMSRALGMVLLRFYSLAIVIVAFIAGRRRPTSRSHVAVIWLALLNLSALQSGGAWGDYTTLGTAWLLTLSAASQFEMARAGSARAGLLVLGWVLFFVVPGVQPMPVPLPTRVAMALTLTVTVSLVAFNARMALRSSKGAQEP